jgi:hypothetical protein
LNGEIAVLRRGDKRGMADDSESVV